MPWVVPKEQASASMLEAAANFPASSGSVYILVSSSPAVSPEPVSRLPMEPSSASTDAPAFPAISTASRVFFRFSS